MSPANYSRRSPQADAREGSPQAASLTLPVPAELAGLRLDQALARMLPAHSRTRLKTWIEAGHVKVDGATWDARRRVAGAERIDVTAPRFEASIADAA